MQWRLIAILALFLLVPNLAAAEYPAPDRYDWSAIQPLFTVPREDKLPPVRQDDAGNFHAFFLQAETSVLTHTVVDITGELIGESQSQLPRINDKTILTAIPRENGLAPVWATPDEDGFWHLYICEIDSRGEVSNFQALNYNLSTPVQVIDTDLDSMRVVTQLDAGFDSKGRLHLCIVGGIPREQIGLYLKFDENYQFQHIEQVGRMTIYFSPTGPSGGQMLIDAGDNVYCLFDLRGALTLDKIAPDGTVTSIDVGRAVYDMRDPSGTLYTARRVGPVMAIDDEGVVHLAYNYLTQYPRLTPHIVDVAYVQVRDGEVMLEKIITNEQGVSHYPTVTTNNGKVYITWEETSGGQEIFYSVLDSEGNVLSNFNRLTWGHVISRLGIVYADANDNLHAFWWRPGGEGQDHLAYKNTVNPVPDSFWLRIGLNPHDPDSSLAGQILYYSLMVIITGIAQMVANLHLLLYIIVLLFILYKLQVLSLLLERPWTFFFLLLIALYPLMPKIAAADTAFPLTHGFYFFAWLIGSLFSSGFFLLFKIKPNSTPNLMAGCIIWLLLVVLVQMIPIVPQSFAL